MKTALATFVAITFISSTGASAGSLCNCCSEGTAASCTTACQDTRLAAGQCLAVFDPAGEATIGPDQNPLYDISLRHMHLESADKEELEAFRRLLERARQGAEADRKAALRAHKGGKIDDPTAQSLATRYDDAMVNYYLGIQAYRLARSAANQSLASSP